MPINMLFKYRYPLLFLQQVHENEIDLEISKNERTCSKAVFQP